MYPRFTCLPVQPRSNDYGKVARYFLIDIVDRVLKPPNKLHVGGRIAKDRARVQSDVTEYEPVADLEEAVVDTRHDFKLDGLIGKDHFARHAELPVDCVQLVKVVYDKRPGRERGRQGGLSKHLVAGFILDWSAREGRREGVPCFGLDGAYGRLDDRLEVHLREAEVLPVDRQVEIRERRCGEDAERDAALRLQDRPVGDALALVDKG